MAARAPQVFVYPPSLQLNALSRNAGIVRERRFYVIRNARLDPKWAQINRNTFSIAERAISSPIQTQSVGDLYRIYVSANRDKIDFNLASIPETFTTRLKQPFDTAYMNALFNLGYDLGAKGHPWAKFPPGYRGFGAGPTLTTSAVPEGRSAQATGRPSLRVSTTMAHREAGADSVHPISFGVVGR